MRAELHPKLIAGRLREGPLGTSDSYGANGMFHVTGPMGSTVRIVASDTTEPESKGWEHVSISLPNRCPNWPEMCFVKDLFWDPEELVVQFHPPKSLWISNHPYCLHLWRDTRSVIALPPAIMIGIQSEGTLRGPKHAARLMRDHGFSV